MVYGLKRVFLRWVAIRDLNFEIVGASTISAGREFQWAIMRVEKNLFLGSVAEYGMAILNLWPLVPRCGEGVKS